MRRALLRTGEALNASMVVMAEETVALEQVRPVDEARDETRDEALDETKARVTLPQVLNLALPAVAEQMLNMMVGLVDTFLVGHLGAASLAGVGLGNQFIFLATSFFAAVATGATALVARHIGAREPALANKIMNQSLTVGLVMALPLTLICFFGATAFMQIMGAQPDVVPLGAMYMRIVAPTLLASGLMFVGNAALRGAGDTRTPMMVMAVVNAVNIVVASLLVYGLGPFPALGVAGSALGAAIGRTSGCVLVMLLLLRGRSGLRLSLPQLRPDKAQLRRIMNIGLPAGVELLVMRLGMTVFAAVVAGLGTAAYAAHQVVMTSESISFMPGFGFGIAAATLMGQGLGARDPQRAEDGGLMSVKLAVAVMSSIGVLFFLFPQVFMGIFTSDPEVIALGIMPLRIIAIAQPFLALTMTLSGALRGAGDTRGPLIVTTIGIWFVRIPLAFLLIGTAGFGLPAAWITMLTDQAFRSVFFVRRFRIGKWKLVRV